jgi:hypothetical protein
MRTDHICTTIYLHILHRFHQTIHFVFLQENIQHEQNRQGCEHPGLFRNNVVHRDVFYNTLPSSSDLRQLESKSECRKGHEFICHIHINIYYKHNSGYRNSYNTIVRNLDAAYATNSEMACQWNIFARGIVSVGITG